MENNYENLRNENEALRKEIKKLKSRIAADQKFRKDILSGIRDFFMGKSFNKAMDAVEEDFKSQGLPTKKNTFILFRATLNRLLVWRTLAFIIAGVPTMVLVFQTCYLSRQNEILFRQNALIEAQTKFFEKEVALMASQTNALLKGLEQDSISITRDINDKETTQKRKESELLENRMEKLKALKGDIINDLKGELNTSRGLSTATIESIVHFSKGCTPYEYLFKSTSPERGELLLFLLESELNPKVLNSIWEKADFRFCDFGGKTFPREARLKGDFEGSNFMDCKIVKADFSQARLNRCNFKGSTLWASNLSGAELMACDFTNAGFGDADLSHAKFSDSNISSVRVSEKTNFYNSDFSDAYAGNISELDSFLVNSGLDHYFTIDLEKSEVKGREDLFFLKPK